MQLLYPEFLEAEHRREVKPTVHIRWKKVNLADKRTTIFA